MGNLILALDCALKAVKYLPRKLKNQLKEETLRIKNRINKEAQANSHFTGSLQKTIDRKKYQIANEEEEAFVDKITTFLDAEHLLTQNYGIPTKSRSMSDIQKTVDKARFDSEL
jgi:ribosomal protein L31E